MKKISFFWITVICLCLGLTGCYNDALDPTQLGRFEPTPTVNVILDTLGVADEPSPTYVGAEEPRPEDLLVMESDYTFSSGDIVQISIFELYQEGQNFVNQYIVTETGRLSIPDVGIIMAEGLTETELEREIANILSPNIIKDPSVTATLIRSERRLFSVVGQGVAQNARFQMPRYPIRLTDAIALAGGVGDFNVSNIYISREVKSSDMQSQMPQEVETPTQEPERINVEDQMLEMITPSVRRSNSERLITTSEMATRTELEQMADSEGLDPLDELFEESGVSEPIRNQTATRIEWIFEDGQWKPIEVESAVSEPSMLQPEPFGSEKKAVEPQIPNDFGIDDIGGADTTTRVICIPIDRLLAGDPRYNIVIRPADSIMVPRDVVGEFWVTGNVNAPNAYNITGRPITLKQAIATAGGLNSIAWPKKVEVVRRIGKNKAGLMQEEIVLVDLEKISKGLQPDFFIKPYDYINVGTHGTSRWLAVLRNAFRATYGFGLIYDRNFATTDFGDNPLPSSFSDIF